MFPDSDALKQYFHCSFLSVGDGDHTIGQFLWISDPLGDCMKDELYTSFIFNNYSSFVNSLLHLVRSYVVNVFMLPQ